MLEVGDKGIHTRTGNVVEITKIGGVTYGIYDAQRPGICTVPHEDVVPARDLSLLDFQTINKARSAENAGGEEEWSLAEWTNALAGEVGEACNIAKKCGRGLPNDPDVDDVREDLAYELADVVTYATIIANKLGINLGDYTAKKFNIVSLRRGSDLKL